MKKPGEGTLMKKRILIGFCAWLILGISLSPGQTSEHKEEIVARVLQGSQQYTESVKKIKITIDSYTTEEEVQNLIQVMTDKGYEPFMDAYRALNKGIFFPIGGPGIKIIIHGAHSIPTEKGRQILLFTTRQPWDVTANQRIDPRFSFMVIELNVDNKGKGTGNIYEQASLKLTPQLTFEMDGYNAPPKQLWDVRLQK
jgi:hypothetical protein